MSNLARSSYSWDELSDLLAKAERATAVLMNVDDAVGHRLASTIDLIERIFSFALRISEDASMTERQLTATGLLGLENLKEALDRAARILDTTPLIDDNMSALDLDEGLTASLRKMADPVRALGVERSAVGQALTAMIDSHLAEFDAVVPLMRRMIVAREIAERAAADASNAAQSARADAGATGDLKLAVHFQSYAGQELRIGLWYRVAAFVFVATAVGVGAWLYLSADDYEPVSDHLARGVVVLGIAAVGTYCARLAGQHRHNGNWAKTIAVQLQEFTRFMEPVTDDQARATIQTQFASRVLGALPAPGESPTPVMSDQLITAVLNARR